MKREELEKAIEKGESVWYPKGRTIKQIDLKNTHLIFNGYQIDNMIEDENGWHTEFYGIEDLYKTKAEAEHYLHHANITRTETLPFLTWEEFLKEYSFDFYCENHEWFTLYWNDGDGIVLESIDGFYKKTWDLTEANFYKAYDECVRLFRGGE